MSAAIRALHVTSCVFCPDPIKRGDLIVYASDDRGWCHEDCERHPEPWDSKPLSPTLKFHAFMERQGTFTNQLLDNDIDLNELPLAIQKAAEKCMTAWGALYSLLEDVASEHREEVR